MKVTLLILLCCCVNLSWSSARPNIVLILADDLGYGDVGFLGGDIPTPNIDRIALEGVRLTNFHVPASVCTPSRSAIHSAVHPARYGCFDISFRGAPIPDQPSLPTLLRSLGYRNGMVGRWDLGDSSQGPFALGYDEVSRRPNPPPEGHAPTYLGDDGSYWTTNNVEELPQFIKRNADVPFFLYYSPLAVHIPVTDAPKHFRDRVPATITDPMRRALGGSLIAFDDAVGAILETLDEEGLTDKTIIFFASDNGGELGAGASNAPWSGGKATYGEGGFRVPGAVCWPGRIPPGTVYPGLASAMDILPTLVAAAGGEAPDDRDGVDLLPFLMGEAVGDAHLALFFRYYTESPLIPYKDLSAVRSGPWRYLEYTGPGDPSLKGRALYHLDTDPLEEISLMDRFPEVAARLRILLDGWEAGISPIPEEPIHRGSGSQADMPRGRGWVIR